MEAGARLLSPSPPPKQARTCIRNPSFGSGWQQFLLLFATLYSCLGFKSCFLCPRAVCSLRMLIYLIYGHYHMVIVFWVASESVKCLHWCGLCFFIGRSPTNKAAVCFRQIWRTLSSFQIHCLIVMQLRGYMIKLFGQLDLCLLHRLCVLFRQQLFQRTNRMMVELVLTRMKIEQQWASFTLLDLYAFFASAFSENLLYAFSITTLLSVIEDYCQIEFWQIFFDKYKLFICIYEGNTV